MRYKIITCLLASLVLLSLFVAGCALAEPDYDKLVNAIYKAEGGAKAQYLYGIRSVPYKDEAEARKICYNTLRNQFKRHLSHDCGFTYMVCLRNRYCPLEANKNDPKGLNSNWLKNVRYFYVNQ